MRHAEQQRAAPVSNRAQHIVPRCAAVICKLPHHDCSTFQTRTHTPLTIASILDLVDEVTLQQINVKRTVQPNFCSATMLAMCTNALRANRVLA
jgi:hypothetical protein